MTVLAVPRGRLSVWWLSHPLVATGLIVAVAVGLRMWTPTDDASRTVCLVRRCAGIACPGCGLTRAVAYLLRGDLGAMWTMHPLALLFALDTAIALGLVWLVHFGRVRLRANHAAVWAALHVPLLTGVWIWRALDGWLPV